MVHDHRLESLFIAVVEDLVILLLVFIDCDFLLAVNLVHLADEPVWLRMQTHRLFMNGIRQILSLSLPLVQVLNQALTIKEPRLGVVHKCIGH